MTQSPAGPLPPPPERRRLRVAASLTRAQIAALIGVTVETVSAWEAGRTTPEGRTREAYARLLASLARTNRQKTEPTGQVAVRPSAPEQPSPSAAGQPSPPAAQQASAPAPRRAGPATTQPMVPAALLCPGNPPELRTAARLTTLTPAQAFDALYTFCAPALVRQTFLLTGRRERARESVEQAFELAWLRWPEVARDRDPAGWVRAVAYDCALSPWHGFRLRHRRPDPPPPDPCERALLQALLRLPPSYRRTLVLYDGVGLDLPETAAETEASTPAAARRLLHAREAVAACVPELADPAELHRRLTVLASTDRGATARPTTVRTGCERRTRLLTRSAIALTAAIVGATTLTLRTAPTHYEAPVAPGVAIGDLPPRTALGPLSAAELQLQARLRAQTASGPERLVPEVR